MIDEDEPQQEAAMQTFNVRESQEVRGLWRNSAIIISVKEEKAHTGGD